MSGGRRDGRSVFVGNIPYDATEEHLRELFAEVGEVVSFRLMMDKDTGRPKGFGFCEYKDLVGAGIPLDTLASRRCCVLTCPPSSQRHRVPSATSRGASS